MFLYNKGIILSIVLPVLVVSCTVKKSSLAIPVTTDSMKSVDRYNRYDSLYNLFLKTNNIDFLKQGGIVADSVLSTAVPSDTVMQKKYFSLLFNRAADLNDLHNYIKSREFFDKYIFLYKQYDLSQPENLAYARFTVANVYSRYEDYTKAALLLKQALNYYTDLKDTETIASCILNIAIPLKQLQLYPEAEQILQSIFQLPSVKAKRKARACIDLADIFIRQHRVAAADEQIKKAQQLLADAGHGNDITETYAALYTIGGDLLMAKNDPQQAIQSYHQSIDSQRHIYVQNLRNRESGKTLIAMGNAFEQLGFSDSALNCYSRALYNVIDVDTLNSFSLPLKKNLYAENTIAEALFARAGCIINRKKENIEELENAINCYQLAFATKTKLLNAFSYDESRLHIVGEMRAETEKAISLCYQLYKKTNNSRWANEAFLFAEHNKAFVLEESVRRNTAASLFLQNDTLYKEMQQLQSNLALTEIELGKQHFAAVPDTALIQSLNNSKQKTEEALLATENNIRIKNPQYNNWMNEETTLTAEDIIHKTIATNTGMVEYFSGDSSLYAFSTSENKPLNFFKLNDTVKIIAADFLHFFSNQQIILNNPAQYAGVAANLYQLLLKPCFPEGNSSTLIIPDGFIAYIPFDALLTNTTASTNIASFPFLIKQQEIYYAFSCKTLLAQAQIQNNPVQNSLLAMAPVFAHNERGLSSLLHSNEELQAIKELYPKGKFFEGDAATLQQFEDNCSNASIIHLATHASPGTDSLPARIELFDAALYINSLYAKKINAKLVVLSGCETGTGTLNKSEGLMSLARSFSYAGTKNVIASLWQTEDNSSATIFKNFYSNLPDHNFSAALRNAKLALLNNTAVAAASPYYWSGYIYIGTPEENAPAPSSYKLQWLAALTSLLIIIAYLIFVKKRRQQSIR